MFFFSLSHLISERNGSVKRPSVWNCLLKPAIMRHINVPMQHVTVNWMDCHRIRGIHWWCQVLVIRLWHHQICHPLRVIINKSFKVAWMEFHRPMQTYLLVHIVRCQLYHTFRALVSYHWAHQIVCTPHHDYQPHHLHNVTVQYNHDRTVWVQPIQACHHIHQKHRNHARQSLNPHIMCRTMNLILKCKKKKKSFFLFFKEP